MIVCQQHEIESWLKLASFFFEKTNTLFVLDDCAASKDVKGRTSQLVNLGFSARHDGISVWVLTQQITSIAKPFRENVAAIVLFYIPSGKTTKAIFEDYAGEITHDEYKELIAWLKEHAKVFPPSLLSALPIWNRKKDLKKIKHYIYTHTMSNQLTVFSQLLNELRQNVIKAECEGDLHYTLLIRYPVMLIEVTDPMVELIQKATELLREIQKNRKIKK